MRYVLKLHQTLRRNKWQVVHDKWGNSDVSTPGIVGKRGESHPDHDPETGITLGQDVQRHVHGLPTGTINRNPRNPLIRKPNHEFIERW